MLLLLLSAPAMALDPTPVETESDATRDDEIPRPPDAPRTRTQSPIVNGTVEAGVPSAVGLGAAGFTVCSGALITPELVLTAAHCGDGVPLTVVVDVGEATFGVRGSEPDFTRGFTDLFVHPDYVELVQGVTLGRNDVSVLVLDEPVTEVEPVWFRTAPFEGDQGLGAELLSVGFGLTEQGTQGEKRSALLTIDEIDDDFLISNSGTNDDGANICSGDSGGPQYKVRADGTLLQWGVHSWGDVGCVAQSGSIRTDVVADWILDRVEDVHGSRDRCEVHGLYEDGVCHPDCDRPDWDCIREDLLMGGTPRATPLSSGCSTGPGAPALLLLALPWLFRRRGA
ncbi:MAG: trypsin-like serine protease [Myxococcales bacterium]|nr:trypsin-like serine protease [Myxococcales bacterium]